MQKNLLPLVLLLAPLASTTALAARPHSPAATVLPGEILVRFKALPAGGLRPAALGIARAAGDGLAAQTLKSRMGLARSDLMLNGQIERLQLPGYLRLEDALAQLNADPSVQWAEPVYRRNKSLVVPNDSRFGEQWPLRNTGQTGGDGTGTPGADMNLANAWDANNDGVADRTDSSAVKLALVDDGFQLNHPDLANSFNVALGRDVLSDDNDPSPVAADDIHGTLVAGAAGAVGNNGIGIAGPAWRSQLIPIRFGFDSATEVKAFDYARAQGAKVINASFGGPIFSNAERDSIEALRVADIVLVAAAGNSDSNTDLAKAAYPANYELGNIVSVAANNRSDRLTGFTQYGPITTDVSAPGLQVLTTSVGGSYQNVSGTSFSSPYTAGVAALIRAVYPSADYNEVKARLIEGAAAGSGLRSFASGGRVDASASLTIAARPSLVIRSASIDDSASGDGDGALDPGESATAVIVLENLWMAASNVSVTLSSSSTSVTAATTPQTASSISRGGTVSLRFPVTIAGTAKAHEIVDLTIQITATGYSAARNFNAELGRLDASSVTNAGFGSGLRDEFHTWHFDLPSIPAGHSQLVVTSTAGSDIDIIVKRAAPPQYEVSLGADPESASANFFADVPDAQIGGGPDGNETVTVNNPGTGAWFVTVVNYTQSGNVPYTLQFKTQAGVITPPTGGGSSGGGSSGGIGALPGGGGGGGGGAFIALPLLLAAARRRKRA